LEDRPCLRDLHEQLGISLERDQLFKFGWPSHLTISHVVDHYGQTRVLFERQADFLHAGR
jgi:hypothetical protein